MHPISRLPLAVSLASLLLISSSLRADWLVLSDGTRLLGTGYKKVPATSKQDLERVHFTLITGQRIAVPVANVKEHVRSPKGETVTWEGQTMTVRQHMSRIRKERAEKDGHAIGLVEAIAQKKSGHEKALEVFNGWDARQKERILGKTLLESKKESARQLAAEELVAYKSSHAARCLIDAAMGDRREKVREASYRSLRIIDHPKTSKYLLPYLARGNETQRIRASNAVRDYPSDGGIEVILGVLTRTWRGFGRAHIFQGTQRAYIGDYELVSGGTGFNVVEVADPVVRTTQTGVVLDVKITGVEQKTHLRTLRRVTGQEFGADLAAWKRWWIAAREDWAPDSSP